MKNFFESKIFSTGLLMFSMFFGAGNVIFPLVIGYHAQNKTCYAVLGLLITAVIMPFAGLIAMTMYEGNYIKFFSRLGKIPGFLIALLIITLLGPLGSTPRCIALSYSTLKISIPSLNPFIFNGISCLLIYFLAISKNKMTKILGNILTPILLISLLTIMIAGFCTPANIYPVEHSDFSLFLYGLQEGYNTMDLLAAFFFSSVVISSLKNENEKEVQPILLRAIKSSCVGIFLLATTYIGFSCVAAFHGQNLDIQGTHELLGALTLHVMGSSAGFIFSLTIALACLTTAVALSSVFASFLQSTVLKNRVTYKTALVYTVIANFFVSNWEFEGISAFLIPILQICYPGLIVLTLVNAVYWMKKDSKLTVPLKLSNGDCD